MTMRLFRVWGFVLLLLVWSVPSVADEEQPRRNSPPKELLSLLHEIHKQYGADTVALVSWLLDATVHNGSILTASIKVNGLENHFGQNFLVLRLETGMIFNSLALDQAGRLEALWQQIIAPAFTQLKTLTIPADGVMVSLLYNYKPYQDTEELIHTLDNVGTPEEAKFYFPSEALRAYLSTALSPQELIDHSTITVDGTPVPLFLSTTSTNGRGDHITPDS
jgi:hypothetical protein